MIKFLLFLLISINVFGQIKYWPLYNHTENEREMVVIAERLSNEMAQAESFRKFMVDRKLIKTNGRTNSEVVQHLGSLNISVPVHMYSSWTSGTVGYRNPPRPDIYTNRKFHAGASACARASNLMHEWTHSGGYSHSYKGTYKRPYSVPYSINAAFRALCACNGIKDCLILDKPMVKKTKIICYRSWYTLWIKKKCYTKSL